MSSLVTDHKYLFISLILVMFITGCSPIPRSFRQTTVKWDEDDLKKDVDYAYYKLQKWHAKLDWYISQQELEHKLDSLKTTLNAPMTSNEFYMQLSPVIASIKQGHTQIFQLPSPEIYKQLIALEKGKGTPLAYFDFEIFENRLFIVENKKSYPRVSIGSEVVSINGLDPQQLISEYQKTFASDGYNTTYPVHRLGHEFPGYLILRTGKADSIQCQLKYNDTIQDICLTRMASLEKTNKQPSQENSSQSTVKEKSPPKWNGGSLKFPGPDSTIAVLKIESFYGKNYYSFLKYCFQTLNAVGTQHLVLDLRDNPGGSALGASTLLSYLIPQPGPFVDTIKVLRRTSIMHTPWYVGQSISTDIILTLALPFRLLGLSFDYFSVKKREDDSYYLKTGLSRAKKPNPIQFGGPVYVLINGGTFSAASLLSSNLKGSQRAIFVGEETGGAYNGAVAGKFAMYQLPASNLRIIFGLALIQPQHKTDIEGRGIFPDIEIKPTLEDRMKGNDPELNWVLEHIHSTTSQY